MTENLCPRWDMAKPAISERPMLGMLISSYRLVSRSRSVITEDTAMLCYAMLCHALATDVILWVSVLESAGS